jgi:hypothetical protein
MRPYLARTHSADLQTGADLYIEFKHHHLRSEVFLRAIANSMKFLEHCGKRNFNSWGRKYCTPGLLGILILVSSIFELSRNVRLFRWIPWRICGFYLSLMCNSWHGGASRWSWHFHSTKSWGQIMQEQEWKRIAFRHARKQRPPTPGNRNHGSAMKGVSPQRARKTETNYCTKCEESHEGDESSAGCLCGEARRKVIKQDAGTTELAHRDYDKNLSTFKKNWKMVTGNPSPRRRGINPPRYPRHPHRRCHPWQWDWEVDRSGQLEVLEERHVHRYNVALDQSPIHLWLSQSWKLTFRKRRKRGYWR